MFLQNHDQIGNRPLGSGWTTLADRRALEAAIALQLLSPQISLIFMGEEDASQSPFLFFAQHDEGLAQSIREGRRREFESTANAVDDLPVPTIPRPSSSPSPKGFRSSQVSALLSTAGFCGYDANILRPRWRVRELSTHVR
jgi:1,4-alpha-glucan branching enzyme